MKVRHVIAALRHDPWFVLTHGSQMFAHTFRGTTWRSWCGLEGASAVFDRYREIRAREREYLAWPDPLAAVADQPADAAPDLIQLRPA